MGYHFQLMFYIRVGPAQFVFCGSNQNGLGWLILPPLPILFSILENFL